LDQRLSGKYIEEPIHKIGTGSDRQCSWHVSSLPQYRVRAADLPPETAAVLTALRQLTPQLCLVDLGALAETVRRTLRREACLGWKARLEKSHPLLLLDQPEIDELVRSLAEAETALRQINRGQSQPILIRAAWNTQ
jgi:hypothetical protein